MPLTPASDPRIGGVATMSTSSKAVVQPLAERRRPLTIRVREEGCCRACGIVRARSRSRAPPGSGRRLPERRLRSRSRKAGRAAVRPSARAKPSGAALFHVDALFQDGVVRGHEFLCLYGSDRAPAQTPRCRIRSSALPPSRFAPALACTEMLEQRPFRRSGRASQRQRPSRRRRYSLQLGQACARMRRPHLPRGFATSAALVRPFPTWHAG